MKWKVEVWKKPSIFNHEGEGISKDIIDLGISGVSSVSACSIYILEGNINEGALNNIGINLLSDPITEEFKIMPYDDVMLPNVTKCCQEVPKGAKNQLQATSGNFRQLQEKSFSNKGEKWVIEVYFKKGVADPAGENTLKGIKDIGVTGVNSVSTGKKYIITGKLSQVEIENICKKLLANNVINDYFIV